MLSNIFKHVSISRCPITEDNAKLRIYSHKGFQEPWSEIAVFVLFVLVSVPDPNDIAPAPTNGCI